MKGHNSLIFFSGLLKVLIFFLKDGFSVILKVNTKSSKLLKKNGMLILEIDNTQVIKTKEMLKNYKFYTKDVFKDLSDKNRCITAIKL